MCVCWGFLDEQKLPPLMSLCSNSGDNKQVKVNYNLSYDAKWRRVRESETLNDQVTCEEKPEEMMEDP